MSRRSIQIVPGDVPPADAAHRLGLTLAKFLDLRPELDRRGFPPADPTTGLYDLDAIDAWRRHRHPHLFQLTTTGNALDARPGLVAARLGALRRG